MHIMNDNNLYPRFSAIEFSNRYARVRAAMQEAGLSALVLHGTAGSYQEIQYLSNFLVTREAILVFPQNGEPTLFVQYYNHLPSHPAIFLLYNPISIWYRFICSILSNHIAATKVSRNAFYECIIFQLSPGYPSNAWRVLCRWTLLTALQRDCASPKIHTL